MMQTVIEKINEVKTKIDNLDSRFEAGFFKGMEDDYFTEKADLRNILQDLFMIQRAA